GARISAGEFRACRCATDRRPQQCLAANLPDGPEHIRGRALAAAELAADLPEAKPGHEAQRVRATSVRETRHREPVALQITQIARTRRRVDERRRIWIWAKLRRIVCPAESGEHRLRRVERRLLGRAGRKL